MFTYPNEYYAADYRARHLEEQAQRDLLKQCLPSRKPFYARVLALLGRVLVAVGARMQGQQEARPADRGDYVDLARTVRTA
jgi:hypothetical protein